MAEVNKRGVYNWYWLIFQNALQSFVREFGKV